MKIKIQYTLVTLTKIGEKMKYMEQCPFCGTDLKHKMLSYHLQKCDKAQKKSAKEA